MDIVQNIDRGTIIECKHCKGRGVCQHSSEVEVRREIVTRGVLGGREIYIYIALSCNHCGQGITGLNRRLLIPPLCAVCRGIGSVRI